MRILTLIISVFLVLLCAACENQTASNQKAGSGLQENTRQKNDLNQEDQLNMRTWANQNGQLNQFVVSHSRAEDANRIREYTGLRTSTFDCGYFFNNQLLSKYREPEKTLINGDHWNDTYDSELLDAPFLIEFRFDSTGLHKSGRMLYMLSLAFFDKEGKSILDRDEATLKKFQTYYQKMFDECFEESKWVSIYRGHL